MKYLNLLLLMLSTIGLVSVCRPPGYPPIEELLIDASVLPEGWSASEAGPHPISRAPLGGTKSVESIEFVFYAYGGSAFEEIRRFKSYQEAVEEFARQKRQVFRVTKFNTPWVVPEGLSYKSPVADQFHYACSQDVGSLWSDCAYIARYGVYFVQFHTDMLPGYMSYTDLEKVLQAIDARMAPYVEMK